jgi:uncharacterized protein
MKIRSITYFLNPGWPLDLAMITQAGNFVSEARSAYQSAGYEVQTARLATIPFPFLVPSLDNDELIDLAKKIETSARQVGFDYVSLGPASPELLESYKVIPSMIKATESIFLSGLMTCDGGYISLPAVRACSEVIHQIAMQSEDGFSNLRFAAAANVASGGPFFPVAYHDVQQSNKHIHVFALATEAADMAVTSISQAGSLSEARDTLIQTIESHAGRLADISNKLVDRQVSDQHPLHFGGFDFTLAPFPKIDISFGNAMEQIGVPAVGMHGSLAAAAFITHSLDLANYPRTGFNGLMLPLLEDAVLALRAEQNILSLTDLLLYSAVCGTGLDTIPLPGDVTKDQLTTILLDLSALAQRLDKPLIARLMPIPGKVAGEMTNFNFPFFANSRVLSVRSEGVAGLFAGDEMFRLGPK